MAEFYDVPERISFPKEEEKISEYWDKIDAFQKSLRLSKEANRPEYSFYDGPPFATGLPHYGHILAGTIKDIVTRYAHQTGHHVERHFGWDCHGLPVEYEIDNKLGIKSSEDVEKMGISAYNAECRAIVMRYSSEWEKTVKRMGRWIDFQNDYKTMNLSFMESVWWVFKQLFEKGLVYRGFKVMPYSTACHTPLSNFEANQNYKEVSDPSVVVTFPLVDEPDVSILAWTTTPWTLPSNLALCVNPDFEYVRVIDNATKSTYIIARLRLEQLYKSEKEYTVIGSCTGSELVGKKYQPLFPYFYEEYAASAFRVIADGYVTSDSGTGIVHCAPAFGEDDYRVCLAHDVIHKGENVLCPVDDNGNFTSQVPEFAGKHVKAADKEIIKHLKTANRLVSQGTLVHSYPFCWRSETPLIYRAVPSWFVRVEDIKEKLLHNNTLSRWVPEFVQEKRFHNWLRDARDWAISRNRYWGTPIPIWANEDFSEVIVVGSVEELEQLSGKRPTDLHREFIDDIVIPSKKTPGTFLKRVTEVFDCWFESGSMPYAAIHYPFENKERFEHIYPADFIAEGLDQTRGWFYTLLVLSTALFDKPPFKNLIVNGLVLAADGKKMSKRLKNYPEPTLVIDEYGADAIRLYLINSPVVRAEPLRFKIEGVRDVVKDVFLPWFNAYRFFTQNARILSKTTGKAFVRDPTIAYQSSNIMDKWILASTQNLIAYVREEMAGYRLYTVVPRLVKFIDQLTNWYVRFNRKRLKNAFGEEDCRSATSTLFEVLYSLCLLMAPFTPFLVEMMYQNLKLALSPEDQFESVHFGLIPEVKTEALDARIEEAVSRMQDVIVIGRAIRDRKNLPLKTPLRSVTVVHRDAVYLGDIVNLSSYIKEELNVRDVNTTSDENRFISLSAETDNKALGKRLGKELKAVSQAVAAFTHDQIMELQASGSVVVNGHTLSSSDIKLNRSFKSSGENAKLEASTGDDGLLVLLDCEQDASLRAEGVARDVANRIQKMRKKAGLNVEDTIEVYFAYKKTQKAAAEHAKGDDDEGSAITYDELSSVLSTQVSYIQGLVNSPVQALEKIPPYGVRVIEEAFEVSTLAN
eukprot:TRINITY_DN871_c0_g2_i3.p1 TRINITY_DN871_c0_g2~~TRINITY_DN871_c0_g2_i3.p1  ORF type:complete len:1086 (-),score=232.87 TRINITY_DN871_c0_g2_i3:2461-5718(-)